MSVSKWVNRFFAPFDLAVIRRTNLNKLVENHDRGLSQQAHVAGSPVFDLKSIRDELLANQVSLLWRIVDLRYHESSHSKLICPLCQFSDDADGFKTFQTHCRFGGGRLLRHQCPSCDVIFGAKKMFDLTKEELAQEYEAHYKIYQEGDSTAQELRAFHALRPKKDGIYLNYGAGAWSNSVAILRNDGWNVWSYEPHSSAGISGSAHVISNEKVLSTMKFDGIFSNNVLEHFRYPGDELKSISGFLKPGGLMAHATPCFEYLYEYTRFHLYFFPGRSRGVLANLAGLKIKAYEADGDYMCMTLSAD